MRDDSRFEFGGLPELGGSLLELPRAGKAQPIGTENLHILRIVFQRRLKVSRRRGVIPQVHGADRLAQVAVAR